MSLLMPLIYGFGLVVMLHFNQFKNIANVNNRFELNWSHVVSIQFIVFLWLHVFLICLCYWLIRKVTPSAIKPLFICISWYLLLYSIWGMFTPPVDMFTQEMIPGGGVRDKKEIFLGVWWLLSYLSPFMLALMYSCFKKNVIFDLTKVLICIWAAIGFTLSVGLFFYESASDKIQDIRSTSKTQNHHGEKPPVFIILFVNWSGPRVFRGIMSNELPNIRTLTSGSDYFKYAVSPAPTTVRSVPGLIFNRQGTVIENKKKGLYQDYELGKNALEMDSFFTLFKKEGYFTAANGILPYNKMIRKNDLDFTSSHSERGHNFYLNSIYFMDNSLLYASDPILRSITRDMRRFFISYKNYRRDKEMVENMYYAISHWGNSTFSFFHLMVTHAPFIYNEDGSYYTFPTGKFHPLHDKAGSENYVKALKYTDFIVSYNQKWCLNS